VEEEIENIITTFESAAKIDSGTQSSFEITNSYLKYWTENGNYLESTWSRLAIKVNSVIDSADLTLCLTSKYEYIRERATRRF